jgi:hypothetical protein
MSARRSTPQAHVVTRWRRARALAALVLYFTGVGMLGGVIVERMRFDVAGSRILARQAAITERLHERLMALEHAAGGEPGRVTP